MKKKYLVIALIVILGFGIIAGGFFISRSFQSKRAEGSISVKKERNVLFYRHPMNPKITSKTQQKDEMGMDYIPVYEEDARPEKRERRLLFYRHPMNPKITSKTPQKDEMGMDYIPVYDEETAEETQGTVVISPEKMQKIGVRTEEAKKGTLKHTIRTVGRIDPDESMVFDVNTKIEGWVERLYVNRTDQMVNKGEPLLEIYSPELVATQEEYLLALMARERAKDSPYEEIRRSADSLVKAGRARLKYWDISDEQIERLAEDKKITRTMTIYSTGQGIVTEKMVNEGMKIEPGKILFKIIDHSHVWVYGEAYEYELPFIKIGQKAMIIPSYTPTVVYTATLNNIYTHLGTVRYEAEGKMEGTRTAKVRFSLPNPGYKLKLGQYVNVEIQVDVAKNAVSVPDSAVIDTGIRQVVIVERGNGRFEPREVKVGAKSDGYYQIISGVKAGERVVTSSNFLIDSESSFRAAIEGMKGAEK